MAYPPQELVGACTVEVLCCCGPLGDLPLCSCRLFCASCSWRAAIYPFSKHFLSEYLKPQRCPMQHCQLRYICAGPSVAADALPPFFFVMRGALAQLSKSHADTQDAMSLAGFTAFLSKAAKVPLSAIEACLIVGMLQCLYVRQTKRCMGCAVQSESSLLHWMPSSTKPTSTR